jgi:hypothetical protein
MVLTDLGRQAFVTCRLFVAYLIFPVRENNTGALFAVFVIIGVFSVSILPVTLELASEITRNSETSSAALWTMGNLMPFIFILGEWTSAFFSRTSTQISQLNSGQ